MANMNPVETERVLMVVKTYPTPSAAHGELTCTAGIRLRDMQWIRIYPYPFRLVAQDYRFKKYDVLEIQLQKALGDDPRPDSYRLYDTATIRLIERLEGWGSRMPYIRKTAVSSVRELMDGAISDKTWGPSILPVPVASGSAELLAEHQGVEWPEEDLRKLENARVRLQMNLFAEGDLVKGFKRLMRPPYKFRLRFRDLDGEEYQFPILDWEIAQLYFSSRRRSKTDGEALEKVRNKVEDIIFAPRREVFLILGSIHHRFKQRDRLAVDGFVWPERQLQSSLFGD